MKSSKIVFFALAMISILFFQNCGLHSFEAKRVSINDFTSTVDIPAPERESVEEVIMNSPESIDLPSYDPGIESKISGATYYVATNGNDANPGTLARPWKTIQKCAKPPIQAGDVCIVGDGTYTTTTAGRLVVIGSSSPAGVAGKPITIRAANVGKVSIVVPNTWPGANCNNGTAMCPFTGFYISRPYYTIQGFKFSRPGSYYGSNASVTGVFLNKGADNTTLRFNHFNNIGSNICDNSVMGIAGVYLEYVSRIMIENNKFNTIGRLRNGENGCVTDKFQHDHGVYANGITDLTIRLNFFYDVNRGLPINIKAYTGKTLRAKIFNNTISGKSPLGKPAAQISLTGVLEDIQIKNNIFHDPPKGLLLGWYTTSKIVGTAGIVLTNNLSNTTLSQTDMTNAHLRPPTGIKSTNNIVNTDPRFMNFLIKDFRLSSGSPAINRGINVGIAVKDGKPDIGAYEYAN